MTLQSTTDVSVSSVNSWRRRPAETLASKSMVFTMSNLYVWYITLSMAPPGYVTRHVHRQTSTHGRINRVDGLAVIYRDNFKVKRDPCSVSFKPSSLDVQIWNVDAGKVFFSLLNIYQPPANSRSVFFDGLADPLSLLDDRVSSDRLVVCGDLNFPGLTETTVCQRRTAHGPWNPWSRAIRAWPNTGRSDELQRTGSS